MTTTIVVAALIAVAVLGIGGAASRPDAWYYALRKPRWNPPDWLFAPAWTVILGLAAWSGVLAWTHAGADGRIAIAALFAVNILLHMAWSPLFFNLRRPDWALAEVPFLWLSVAALIAAIAPVDAFAALLLAPYLVWVGFAAVLNLAIVRLNAPFGRRTAAGGAA